MKLSNEGTEGKKERPKFHFLFGSCLNKINKVIMKINIMCLHILEQNEVAIFLHIFLPNRGHRTLIFIFLVFKTVSDIGQEVGKKNKVGKDEERE